MHRDVEIVIDRIKRDVIGGAADISKEVTIALTQMIQDSGAKNYPELESEIFQAVKGIMRVMSSFAPPVNAMNKLVSLFEEMRDQQATIDEIKTEMVKAKEDFLRWANTALERIAQIGAEKVSDGSVVFMYSMSSTVWRILRRAKEQGKSFEVYVTESRPGNEGLWTVEEMRKSQIPVAVSIDACIGELVPMADIVFVGADAIASSGFALCKVGTYPTALVAKAHSVPFYIAADTLKFDATTLIGLPFVSEPLEHFRHQLFSEDNLHPEWKVVGRMFDETPPELITGIITEIGVLPPQACVNFMQQVKLSSMLRELLPDWVHGRL